MRGWRGHARGDSTEDRLGSEEEERVEEAVAAL